jgi:hypothetical protein
MRLLWYFNRIFRPILFNALNLAEELYHDDQPDEEEDLAIDHDSDDSDFGL